MREILVKDFAHGLLPDFPRFYFILFNSTQDRPGAGRGRQAGAGRGSSSSPAVPVNQFKPVSLCLSPYLAGKESLYKIKNLCFNIPVESRSNERRGKEQFTLKQPDSRHFLSFRFVSGELLAGNW
jgi:hypothetical protein